MNTNSQTWPLGPICLLNSCSPEALEPQCWQNCASGINMAPPWTSSVVSKGVETSTLGIYRIWKHDRFKQIQRHSKKFTFYLFNLFVNFFLGYFNFHWFHMQILTRKQGFWSAYRRGTTCTATAKVGFRRWSRGNPWQANSGRNTCGGCMYIYTNMRYVSKDTQIYDMGQIWDLVKI